MTGVAKEAGFTYLGLLILIAITSVTLGATAIVWHFANQQEREKELLFVGSEFARAIAAYYEASPGNAKQFPRRLEDLVRDPRFPSVRRHLRKVYADPVMQNHEWGIVRAADGTIRGIYSLSERTPIKQAEFPKRWEQFAGAKRYSDWVFSAGITGAPGPAVAQKAVVNSGSGTALASSLRSPNDAVKSALSERASPKADPDTDCEALQAADMAACAAAARSFGEGIGLACQASMPGRYAACLQKRRLPPLATKP
jgi:type II secretory pathway pseudopilin PulG